MESSYEYSCGIVPVRYSEGCIEIMMGKQPFSNGFIFPKGHIEKGESYIQTAVRELLEETGHEAVLFLDRNNEWTSDMNQATELPGITYHLFEMNIIKSVYFFIAQVQHVQDIRDLHEIAYVQWFPIEPNLHEVIRTKQVRNLYKGHIFPILSSLCS